MSNDSYDDIRKIFDKPRSGSNTMNTGYNFADKYGKVEERQARPKVSGSRSKARSSNQPPRKDNKKKLAALILAAGMLIGGIGWNALSNAVEDITETHHEQQIKDIYDIQELNNVYVENIYGDLSEEEQKDVAKMFNAISADPKYKNEETLKMAEEFASKHYHYISDKSDDGIYKFMEDRISYNSGFGEGTRIEVGPNRIVQYRGNIALGNWSYDSEELRQMGEIIDRIENIENVPEEYQSVAKSTAILGAIGAMNKEKNKSYVIDNSTATVINSDKEYVPNMTNEQDRSNDDDER